MGGKGLTERNCDFEATLSLVVEPLDFSSVMPLVDMMIDCWLVGLLIAGI